MARVSRLYVWALLMIGLGCALVAGLDLQSFRGKPVLEFFVVGYAIGTLFGQTTVAAFWCAFGSSPLHRRVIVSLAWLTLLLVVIAIGFRFSGVRRELPMVGIALAAQWILIQIPLWVVRYYGRLRLQLGEPTDSGMPQFGLSQLMAFTFGIAMLLGALRWIVTSQALSFVGSTLLVWLFLAGAAVLMSLPLGMAACLPRFASWLGVPLILALIALATAWEHPLLLKVAPGRGPEVMHFVWINTFTSAWVLAFAVAARLNGYRLSRSQSALLPMGG